jgi:O-antigen ligase
MADRLYKILEKTHLVLYYTILFGLFFKGEIFRVKTEYFSFTFTSVKNFVFVFIFVWALLKIREIPKMPKLPVLLVIFAFVSMVFSHYRSISIKAFFVFLAYLLWFYSVKDILKDTRNVLNTVKMLIAISFIINAADLYFHYSVGIKEVIEKYPFWQGKNALGLFLVMSLCVSGCVIFPGKWKILAGVNSVLLLFGIILSYSRGAWIACAIAVFGIAVMKVKRGIWLIIISAVIIFAAYPMVISQRINATFKGEDENINKRIEIWSNTLTMIKENQVLGTGLGTFTKAYRDTYPSFAPEEGEGSRPIRHAHNFYIQMLSETGILGLFITICMLIYGVLLGAQKFLKEKNISFGSIRYGCLLGIVVFLVYSITDCTTSWQFIGDSFSHINLIWILLWAIVLVPGEKHFGT